jgi:hypothetical protein
MSLTLRQSAGGKATFPTADEEVISILNVLVMRTPVAECCV